MRVRWACQRIRRAKDDEERKRLEEEEAQRRAKAQEEEEVSERVGGTEGLTTVIK